MRFLAPADVFWDKIQRTGPLGFWEENYMLKLLHVALHSQMATSLKCKCFFMNAMFPKRVATACGAYCA